MSYTVVHATTSNATPVAGVIDSTAWNQAHTVTGLDADIARIAGVSNTTITASATTYNRMLLLAQSAIPFLMPSSGTFGNNGAVSGLTSMNRTIPACYAYFPADAVYAGSLAAWYYTVMSGTTLGTVYADTYTNGTPAIPASPTALVCTGPGAYTQSTGVDIPGPAVTVPANFLGINGELQWERAINNNNSAGVKSYNTYFGGSVVQGSTQTTNPYEGGFGTVKNAGIATRQTSVNGQHGDVGNAGVLNYTTIDTTSDQVLSMTLKLATATDYAIIESFAMRLCPKA